MARMTSDSSRNLTKKELQEKFDKLQKDLEEKTKLAEERLNQVKYMQADFDNYRKSFEKDKEKIIELANGNLIKELLVIVDDFERALHQIENEKNKEGLILLHKNFLTILENHGLKKIEALGKKFNPYIHEALLKEKSDKEDGIILEEIQSGYVLKSKVIRHSKVKVADNETEIGVGDKNGQRKNNWN